MQVSKVDWQASLDIPVITIRKRIHCVIYWWTSLMIVHVGYIYIYIYTTHTAMIGKMNA